MTRGADTDGATGEPVRGAVGADDVGIDKSELLSTHSDGATTQSMNNHTAATRAVSSKPVTIAWANRW